MKYLHTMVRITDIDESLKFYVDNLGLKELKRDEYEAGRFTLIFLAAEGDEDAQVELTYNWDPEPYPCGRNFGHLAYEVDDIYASMQAIGGWWSHHKSTATRRQNGVRKVARSSFG